MADGIKVPGGLALMTFFALGTGVLAWVVFASFFPEPVNTFLGTEGTTA